MHSLRTPDTVGFSPPKVNKINFRIPLYSAAVFYAVVFDVFTKLTSFYLLPFRHTMDRLDGFLTLYVLTNTSLHGTVLFHFGKAPPPNQFWTPVLGLAFALVLLWLGRTRFKRSGKAAIIVATLVAILVLLKIIGPETPASLDPFDAHVGGLFLLVAAHVIFLSLAKSPYFKFTFSATLSGGIGNSISYLYPPYAPIDFLVFNTISPRMVYNFADLMLFIGAIMLIFSPVFLLLRWIINKIRLQLKAAIVSPPEEEVVL